MTAEDERRQRWSMLPTADWVTAREGRMWLTREQERLGWTDTDVAKAFYEVAHLSAYFIGPGGGETFPRATAARAKRFKHSSGVAIPDWLYWMPLAISFAQMPADLEAFGDKWQWARDNIPEHYDVREERDGVFWSST